MLAPPNKRFPGVIQDGEKERNNKMSFLIASAALPPLLPPPSPLSVSCSLFSPVPAPPPVYSPSPNPLSCTSQFLPSPRSCPCHRSCPNLHPCFCPCFCLFRCPCFCLWSFPARSFAGIITPCSVYHGSGTREGTFKELVTLEGLKHIGMLETEQKGSVRCIGSTA